MMTKSEIISTALDELLERFAANPESFEYIKDYDLGNFKSGDETIIWRTVVNSSNQTIYDPTSQQKTIVISFDHEDGVMKVKIYNQCNMSNTILQNFTPDAVVKSKKIFKALRGNYRKFRKLRDLILKQNEHKEAKEFLKKLSSAFPSILDKHIFGK